MKKIMEIDGERRFKANRIIGFLLDNSEIDLNKTWQMHGRRIFTMDEIRELYQLLGVSVCCYNEVFNGTNEQQ